MKKTTLTNSFLLYGQKRALLSNRWKNEALNWIVSFQIETLINENGGGEGRWRGSGLFQRRCARLGPREGVRRFRAGKQILSEQGPNSQCCGSRSDIKNRSGFDFLQFVDFLLKWEIVLKLLVSMHFLTGFHHKSVVMLTAVLGFFLLLYTS